MEVYNLFNANTVLDAVKASGRDFRQAVDGTFAADRPVRREVLVLGHTQDPGGQASPVRLAN